MNGDISRSSFRPRRHFHDVAMQQGRVQLDADWNEAQAIGSHLDESTRLDTIGPRGVPKVGGGFGIALAPGGKDLVIGAGRLYVANNNRDSVTVIDTKKAVCKRIMLSA